MNAHKKERSFGPEYVRFLGIGLAVLTVALVVFATTHVLSGSTKAGSNMISFIRAVATTTPPTTSAVNQNVVEHISTPKEVRAIYLSQCGVGSVKLRNSVVNIIETTGLNAIVIDIRDYTGRLSIHTNNPILRDMVSPACGALDMRAFIKSLHEKNIYVIGRITTFQNPYYTKLHPEQAVQKKGGGVWADRKGLAFVDVGAKPYWDTVVELGKVSYTDFGFDELNFDYVRFPSDGPMELAIYSWDKGTTKAKALETFFKYLSEGLRPTGVKMSADLFGMTTTNYDDLNIGQVLERALPYFDYIDPMVYPSHYPKGFNGYAKVNDHSYDIVHYSLKHAVERTLATSTKEASFAYTPIASTSPQLYVKPVYPASAIRPWLQSFDYPVVYTPQMVSAQIKANEDAGLHSYLFWDPSNKYRSLKAALDAEKKQSTTTAQKTQ